MKTLVKSDIFVQDGITVLLQDVYCRITYNNKKPVVIKNFIEDERTIRFGLVHKLNIRSYAGVPITLKDGTIFGTLCLMNSSTINRHV